MNVRELRTKMEPTRDDTEIIVSKIVDGKPVVVGSTTDFVNGVLFIELVSENDEPLVPKEDTPGVPDDWDKD